MYKLLMFDVSVLLTGKLRKIFAQFFLKLKLDDVSFHVFSLLILPICFPHVVIIRGYTLLII